MLLYQIHYNNTSWSVFLNTCLIGSIMVEHLHILHSAHLPQQQQQKPDFMKDLDFLK